MMTAFWSGGERVTAALVHKGLSADRRHCMVSLLIATSLITTLNSGFNEAEPSNLYLNLRHLLSVRAIGAREKSVVEPLSGDRLSTSRYPPKQIKITTQLGLQKQIITDFNLFCKIKIES